MRCDSSTIILKWQRVCELMWEIWRLWSELAWLQPVSRWRQRAGKKWEEKVLDFWKELHQIYVQNYLNVNRFDISSAPRKLNHSVLLFQLFSHISHNLEHLFFVLALWFILSFFFLSDARFKLSRSEINKCVWIQSGLKHYNCEHLSPENPQLKFLRGCEALVFI